MLIKVVYWALIALAGWGLLAVLARRMVFHPQRYPHQPYGPEASLKVEDVWLTTSDGVRIHGWWRPSATGLATLFLHGNAGRLDYRDDIPPLLARAGSGVLMIDYRGYGKSAGSPSIDTLWLDADAGYRFLESKGFSSKRIVLHGESLGCAVALELAARRPVAGAVLEAPFTSLSDMAATVIPVIGRTLMSGLDSRSNIMHLRGPLLVVHGDSDEVVPYRMGEELYRLAPGPKKLYTVAGAHHNDLREVAGPGYADRLRDFYRRLPE